jgi:hypothetical protein
MLLVTGELWCKNHARLMYCPVLVSTKISSPILTNNGTLTTAPVSRVAGFDPPANKIAFLKQLASERRWKTEKKGESKRGG